MYHQKIETPDESPALGVNLAAATDAEPTGSKARFYAALIVLCLPIILLWLLTRLLWEEAKTIGRGVAIFYRGAADEISRSHR